MWVNIPWIYNKKACNEQAFFIVTNSKLSG